MARLLSLRIGSLPVQPVKPSALAIALDAASLVLPLTLNGYDAVTGQYGTRLNSGGEIVGGKFGKALRCNGSAGGGGFYLPVNTVSPGAIPGITVIALSSSKSPGENSLGRLFAMTNLNWYPFGSGAYTWSLSYTGGNSSFDTSAGTLPHDGVVRCLGITAVPTGNGFTAPDPNIMVDGNYKTKAKTEWASGTFSGLQGPLYVGNASNNARCFDGDIYFVGIFARAFTEAQLRQVTQNPEILFA